MRKRPTGRNDLAMGMDERIYLMKVRAVLNDLAWD